MARTPEGADLTEQHREAQMSIRAQLLRDFALLWPLWHDTEPGTFSTLVRAALPLVNVYHGISAAAASAYYEAFRRAEDIPGDATPRIAPLPPVAKITTSLYVTGERMTADALAGGQSPQQARTTALVRVSGALSRHVLNGGRQTLIDSVASDEHALGWARVTDSSPCAFCALLASRGPVYKTADSAGFEAHDHCACQAEPFYDGAAWPGRAREYRDLYNQAVRDARAAGELDRGTSNDPLNAFRRALGAQH